MLVKLPDGQWVEHTEIKRIGKLRMFKENEYSNIIELASGMANGTSDLTFVVNSPSLEDAQKIVDGIAIKANDCYEFCLPSDPAD